MMSLENLEFLFPLHVASCFRRSNLRWFSIRFDSFTILHSVFYDLVRELTFLDPIAQGILRIGNFSAIRKAGGSSKVAVRLSENDLHSIQALQKEILKLRRNKSGLGPSTDDL